MRHLVIGAALLVRVAVADAPVNAPDPLRRTSPQSAVLAFLEACKAKDYSRAVHYLDLTKIPQSEKSQRGPMLARDLNQILTHDAQFDIAALSADSGGAQDRERVASFPLNGKTVMLQLERVELRSGARVWRFDSPSVDLIPQLAKGSRESAIERHMPEVLIDLKLLDTPLWQWIAFLCLAVSVSSIAAFGGRYLSSPLLSGLSRRVGGHVAHGLVSPLKVLLTVALFRAGLEWIGIPPRLELLINRGLAFLTIAGVAWLFVALLDIAIARLRGYLTPTHPRFSSSVMPLLARVLKVCVVAFSVVAVLGSWGYNTNAILAGLGIGGIAFALAAQKTIENLFGGVAVVSDKPVFVGDFCKFGDSVGTVEDIGLRSTRIRTVDRTLVTIPNAQFSSMSLENFSRRDKMLFHPVLNLRRDTTPGQVRALLDAVNVLLAKDPRIEVGPIPVRFIGVGKNSLDIEIFAYILTGEGDEFLSVQQELLLGVLDAVSAAGTALALPMETHVVYMSPEETERRLQPARR